MITKLCRVFKNVFSRTDFSLLNTFVLCLKHVKVAIYRNQSFDLKRKSNDWFLYDSNFGF